MTKRVFLSFAIDDKSAAIHLRGQSRNENSPFEFVDMSVKEPWSSEWKKKCRTRIKGCDGVIALISKKTRNADGARWEMQCANDEGVPMFGVHIHKDDKGAIPTELESKRVINWTWEGIKNGINRF